MTARVYQLDLHGKKLPFLQDLSELRDLRTLDASCNQLLKIEGISKNKELRELKLYGNQIKAIEGLEKLKELCSLLLHFNRIKNIGGGLVHAHKLRVLRLDHNLLERISGAAELCGCGPSLTHLDLSHNHLYEVEGLELATNLTELNLAGNRLKQVPSLSRCKKLVELDLSSNPLEHKTLYQLTTLRIKTLHLGSIHLPSLSPLPQLRELQDLHLPHNLLSKITECARLFPSLECLNLRANQLESVEMFSPLSALGGLVEIQVVDNPLCTTSSGYKEEMKELIPNLEVVDGVSLTTDITSEKKMLAMRPLTPSGDTGYSLRQVEKDLLEAEIQLENYESQISAKFDLLLFGGEEGIIALKTPEMRDRPPTQTQMDRPPTRGADIEDNPPTRGAGVGDRPPTRGASVGDRPPTRVASVRDNSPPTRGASVRDRPPTQTKLDRRPTRRGDVGNRPPTQGGDVGNRPPTQGGDVGNRPPTQGGDVGNRPPTRGVGVEDRPPTRGVGVEDRPPTRASSRARLHEALAYSNQITQQSQLI